MLRNVCSAGSEGLAEELDRFGIEHTPIGPEPVVGGRSEWIRAWESECNGVDAYGDHRFGFYSMHAPNSFGAPNSFAAPNGLNSFGFNALDAYNAPARVSHTPKKIDCVLVGMDDYFNFVRLVKASFCLRRIPGCHFLATNLDPVCTYNVGKEYTPVHPTGSQVAGLSGNAPSSASPIPSMIRGPRRSQSPGPTRHISSVAKVKPLKSEMMVEVEREEPVDVGERLDVAEHINAGEHIEQPYEVPAAGCLVQSLVAATGRKPVVLGKPEWPMFSHIQQILYKTTGHPFDPSRALFIGDRSVPCAPIAPIASTIYYFLELFTPFSCTHIAQNYAGP